MDEVKQLIKECKNLVEQGEPFQRKMKAKHSRLKKRVIGHGGQANTPPYSEKPSMKRSKSAPPIGEGFGDFFSFITTKPKEQPKKTEYKYEEGKDYNHVFRNIYVGAAPISGGKIIDSALQTFGLIIVMSKQVADLIEKNEIPDNVVTKFAIEDTINPTPEDLAYLSTNITKVANTVTTSTATFIGASFLEPSVGSQLPPTSVSNFSFFVNGITLTSGSISGFGSDGGGNLILTVNTGNLGYTLVSTDEVTAIGKFA